MRMEGANCSECMSAWIYWSSSVYHFEGGEVKQITTVDSIYRDNEHQANSGIKTINFTSKDKNTENPVYSFILNKNNRTEEVLLELDAKTIEHVKQFFKGKIRE